MIIIEPSRIIRSLIFGATCNKNFLVKSETITIASFLIHGAMHQDYYWYDQLIDSFALHKRVEKFSNSNDEIMNYPM